MMLGLSFANSRQALCCFARFAVLPTLLSACSVDSAVADVDWVWTADTVSSVAPPAGDAATGAIGATAGAGVGESETALLLC